MGTYSYASDGTKRWVCLREEKKPMECLKLRKTGKDLQLLPLAYINSRHRIAVT